MNTAIRLLLVLTLVAACHAAAEATDPVWGKQACDTCRMLISDRRYAAQILDANGEHSFYDDIGCMTERLDALRAPPRAVWVRDPSGRWIDARSARYVASAPSPMDYGFVADQNGTLDFEAVRRGARAHRSKAAQ